MTNLFIIGDIHGELKKLKTLLREWNPDKEQLVLLGDLVDRGSKSKEVVQLAMRLQETYGAVVLKGNHDDMFVDWLNHPEPYLYYAQGGRKTVESFLEAPVAGRLLPGRISSTIQTEFHEEVAFLKNLPVYYTSGNFVMVHAGVDLGLPDWRNTPTADFMWIRHDFHYGKNLTNHTFLFGHTPTRHLNDNESDDIWVSPCGTKIGLDGGAVFGGLLHGLKIDANGQKSVISLTPDNQIKHALLV